MHGLRDFTNNANVVVNFFQSINCLFLQLRWLESNLRNGSNEQIALVLLLVSLLGYYTLVCKSQTNEENGYFCGERGVSALIVCAVLSIVAYFLYKRFRNGPTVTNDPFEQEPFIDGSQSPYNRVEMGRMGNKVSSVVQPAAYA